MELCLDLSSVKQEARRTFVLGWNPGASREKCLLHLHGGLSLNPSTSVKSPGVVEAEESLGLAGLQLSERLCPKGMMERDGEQAPASSPDL